MSDARYPTAEQTEFLNLGYTRFFTLFETLMADDFWSRPAPERLDRAQILFMVYAELLQYPPLKWVIEQNPRPHFTDVGRNLFRFVRNVLSHFPFFESWDDIWIRKSLVTLFPSCFNSIDKFLTENTGKPPIKYRFWEAEKKTMTYVNVTFPTGYSEGQAIHLRDVLPERDGIKFAAVFMRDVLKTQLHDEEGK